MTLRVTASLRARRCGTEKEKLDSLNLKVPGTLRVGHGQRIYISDIVMFIHGNVLSRPWIPLLSNAAKLQPSRLLRQETIAPSCFKASPPQNPGVAMAASDDQGQLGSSKACDIWIN